ncbi:aspartate/glutamate racemase family protein [Mastigocoleus testarum]|uniref:Aspartate racemase n=1 Tax=Mastigocoleus testarum BC008 TaxID=371196 RepID=A0A0V8A0U4_9CYAN|nr:aspartate/glutamate racemase family protein [Mastigocoleus testarum]KST70377.1 hypothetical protein BC008_45085 [Mastigocoleus testarum BC008]
MTPQYDYEPNMLGILGGMGPLASSEFLKTIYEYNLSSKKEQDSPKVILYSDPTFPDRTEALLKQDYQLLLTKLIKSLYYLYELKVAKIVICCITSHYLLPYIPDYLSSNIISLVDIILSKVIEKQSKYLLICTNGTRQMKIFQNHHLWPFAKDYILFPDLDGQDIIHQMIYNIKIKGDISKTISHLELLLYQYEVNSLIVGCTEIHLLNKYLYSSHNNCDDSPMKNLENIFLDPLMIIAKDLVKFF